ncbi:MAG: LCP family protein [Clostridia bacterium]|nr:LCP family protein [Clostridia bacterium]
MLVIAFLIMLSLYVFINYKRETTQYLTINEIFDEGVIKYNNKYYTVKKGIDTYLLIGADDNGGQADVIYILVADNSKKEISLLGINRNIMTKMEAYLPTGIYIGKREMQLCLARTSTLGYVDGDIATMEAVSNLLYGLNIDNYITIYEDGIETIGKIVGNVNIVLNETILDGSLKSGESISIDEKNIEKIIRARDKTKIGGAQKRLERITEYIFAAYTKITSTKWIINTAKTASKSNNDITKAYKELKPFIRTNVTDIQKQAIKYLKYDLKKENIYYIPHLTAIDKNGIYEECYLKEKETKEVLLQVFYKEVLY